MAIDPFTGLPTKKPTIIEKVKNIVHRSGGGGVQSVRAGTNVSVDNADPNNPVVSSSGGGAVDSVNGQIGVVVLDTDDITDTATNRYTNDTDITRLASTSGTNTGDQTLSGLGGVPTSRTINGQDLSANRTFTQDDIGDGSTYKQYSQTEKTKLAGIEDGAEVNNISDANATDLTDGNASTLHYHTSDRDRANHTGTQTASTISDFSEATDDRVNSLLVEGKATDLTYDDTANTLTITGHSNQIIYNSSGGVGFLRFNDWDDVITYLALTGADTDIIIQQNETIPAGSYDLKRARFVGNNGLEYNVGGWTVTFGDSTTITAWQTPSTRSCRLLSTSTTGNIFTSSSSYIVSITAVAHVHSTTIPFFKFTGSGQCVMALNENGRFQKLSGGVENVDVTSAAFACQLILSRGVGSSVSNDIFKSTNTTIYVDVVGSAANDLTIYPTTNTNLVAFNVSVNFVYATTTYHIPSVKNANFNYTRAGEVYGVDATAAARTGSLPAAIGSGVIYTTFKSDNSINTVTVDANGTDVINSLGAWGAGNYVLALQGNSVTLVDYAAGVWMVIGAI